MPTIKRFEEIEAWQTARDLTKRIYAVTDLGKFARDFGLRDQIRRASVSVMSNIAEGFESQTQQQFIRYLSIAKASAGEVRSQLYVSRDLNYLTEEQFTDSPYAVTIKQPLFDRNVWARSENLAKTATYLLRRVRNISY
jgi:four helix bundle protein